MNKSVINKVVSIFMLPFMVLFALYIQIFGEVGPGGGFQAGAIIASAFIAIDLSVHSINKYFDSNMLAIFGSIGVLIYFITGLYSLAFGENFLNYFVLPGDSPQILGILLVEIGVGVTVSAILLLLYMEVMNAD